MKISKSAVNRLVKAHPHSLPLVKCFVPLLEAQFTLEEELPAPALPALDKSGFAQGKPWLKVEDLPLSEGFAPAALKKICAACAKAFPDVKEDLAALKKFLARRPEDVAALTRTGTKAKKIQAWAGKHGLNPAAASLLASQLARAAARRAAAEIAKQTEELPAWNKGHCPVCGGAAHASVLKEKEGKRYLECGLCGHEWRFSRTTCPACGQDSPEKISVTFIENHPEQRAEGCEKCKSYLLGIDTRDFTPDLPLDLYLAAMAPLDILMQEKGFSPTVAE